MKKLLAGLGKIIGIHFTPDNHVVPVLRLERYHRVEGTNFFWINPIFESTLPPVKTGLYVGDFVFEEVATEDQIPFKFQLTVLFNFQPKLADKAAAPQMVRGGEPLFRSIVKDYTNQRLRRLVSGIEAEKLRSKIMLSDIEQKLTEALTNALKPLGLVPLLEEGLLIKEVIPPKAFNETIIEAKRDEIILEILRKCPVPELIQLLYQILFANGLKNHSGQATVIIGSEGMSMSPLLGQVQNRE